MRLERYVAGGQEGGGGGYPFFPDLSYFHLRLCISFEKEFRSLLLMEMPPTLLGAHGFSSGIMATVEEATTFFRLAWCLESHSPERLCTLNEKNKQTFFRRIYFGRGVRIANHSTAVSCRKRKQPEKLKTSRI